MIKDVSVAMGGKKFDIHMERFESAADCVATNNGRQVTNSRFRDVRIDPNGGWSGVENYAEAEELMRTGYQPTVDAMKGVWKGKAGEMTRFSFGNEIVGFTPVVPLALKGVPNCMINMRMTPIKAKVLDVYYDITCSCGTESKDIIKAGQSILGAIIELEKQGYRFNLYGVQTYTDSESCDMLVVKLKSAGQPLDLKRVSFPLTHTAFFRIFGFDWYSRVPNGKYRFGYGHGLAYEFENRQLADMAKQVFGKNATYMTAVSVLNKEQDEIKEVIRNANSEN